MMPERLFNEYTAENELGKNISQDIEDFLVKLISNYPQADLNDLQSLLVNASGAFFAETRIKHATKLRRIKLNIAS